jgi:glycosyltransferase involved in cell wall biosynthesis
LAQNTIQVFVHLAYGFGGESWNRRWKEGKIIGINEPFPYGYHRANAMGCSVVYSQDLFENAFSRFFRLGARAVLGFDLIHAWRNFDKMHHADVIWTHTESQFLSILFLYRLRRNHRRPKMIAQSIWLFDRWRNFSRFKYYLFSNLIREADILTVHSPANLEVAKRTFPEIRSELVLFGISADTKISPVFRHNGEPLKIISLGNDEHRDWDILIKAVAERPEWTTKIASHNVRLSSAGDTRNVEVLTLKNQDELLALYRWADILVLAIKPNKHASGITVIQEAALQGIPIVCSDTGGLRAYFNDSQVRFVPPLDAAALRRAIEDLANHPQQRFELAREAQDVMGPNGLSSESFVRRHVDISRDLLAS